MSVVSSRTSNFSSTTLRGTQALRCDLFIFPQILLWLATCTLAFRGIYFFWMRNFIRLRQEHPYLQMQITYLSSRSRESNCNSANCKPPIAIARRVSNLLRNLDVVHWILSCSTWEKHCKNSQKHIQISLLLECSFWIQYNQHQFFFMFCIAFQRGGWIQRRRESRFQTIVILCVSSSFFIKLWSGRFPVLYVNNSLWCSG